MTRVCLPDPTVLSAVGPLPDGVEVLFWDGVGEPPAGFDRVQFHLAPYLGPANLALFEHGRALEVVQVLSAGVDAWAGSVPDSVALCNGRGVHGASTAELAVLGLLAVIRDVGQLLRDQSAHAVVRRSSDTVDGAAIVVLGAGEIGVRVRTSLTALGADVTLVGRTERDGVRALRDVDDLVRDADAVVIALALTPQTVGLVDARFCSLLADQTIVVNVARGAIVDTEALVDEVCRGRLRAFLDVTEPEPLPPDHRLWDAPNVILTPHVGGGARGWQGRAYALVREQIQRFHRGARLLNVVDRP